MKKIDWLIIVLIVTISLVTLKDLFKPGFYTSHDGPHQVVRLYYFDQAVKDGQLPPRWAGGLLNGYGYPLFIFSYQFPWFIAEPIHLASLSIIDSIKMTFLIGFILSGITMYLYQKEVFGRLAASGGTFLYLFAPYRFSNIFVRAAIGDATTFIFPPLLFLSLYKLRKSENIDWRWVSLGAISLSGIFLSHALVFFFFLLLLLIYSLFWLFVTKNKKQLIISHSALLLLSLGISSYYSIPLILERKLTAFSDAFGFLVSDSFLKLKDLIYSPWGYGMQKAAEGGMSFQLGIAQIVAIILTIGMLLYRLIIRSNKSSSDSDKDASIFIISLCLSIIIMLPLSQTFWTLVKPLISMDFSWRVLAVSIFIISALTGYTLSKIKFPIIFALFLIILALFANRNHLRINKSLDWPVSFYLQLEKTTNTYDEYTPRWVSKTTIDEKRPKVELINSLGSINIAKASSNYLNVSVDSTGSAKVKINTVYYPGWKIWLNNQELSTGPNSDGLMEVPIKSGRNQIVAKFTETPTRLISDFITIFSVGLVGYTLLYRKKHGSF